MAAVRFGISYGGAISGKIQIQNAKHSGCKRKT